MIGKEMDFVLWTCFRKCLRRANLMNLKLI